MNRDEYVDLPSQCNVGPLSGEDYRAFTYQMFRVLDSAAAYLKWGELEMFPVREAGYLFDIRAGYSGEPHF